MPEVFKNISRITLSQFANFAVFNQVVYPAGSSFGPRLQTNVQFVVVYEGLAEVWVADRPAFRIEAGHIGLLLPGYREQFRFCAQRPTHHSYMHLNYSVSDKVLQQALSPLPQVMPMNSRLDALMNLGLDASFHPEPGDKVLLPHLAQTMLWAYIGMAQDQLADSMPEPQALSRVRQHIQQNYAAPITLEDLCAIAMVSANHLIRLFHLHMQTTPIRYLWQVRVNHGIALLRDSGLTVSQIADRVGFQNPFHFSRMVRQQQGLSPRGLRQQFWQMTADTQPET